MTAPSEPDRGRWLSAVSPAIWVTHFALCYGTASIWCAKVAGPGGSLAPVRIAIGVYTALALAGLAVVGRLGARQHRMGDPGAPLDADTPEARRRFLGFATVLLSILSAVAVMFGALVAVFFERCD